MARLILLLAILLSTPAQAVIYNTSNGQLTGIQGIDINGTLVYADWNLSSTSIPEPDSLVLLGTGLLLLLLVFIRKKRSA